MPGPASVQAFMDGLSAIKLQQELALEAEQRPYMSHSEFLQRIKASGSAGSDAAAADLADALCRAGTVLHLNGTVYLRPKEVAELVFRAIPSNPAGAHEQLAEVERELAAMEQQHRQIQRNASRWPRFWLNVGCLAVFMQLVGMAYLTWWELSWDVMEPIAYHLTLVYGCIAYLYFLVTRGGQLDYGPFEEYWQGRLMEKRLREKGFDVQRFHHLQAVRQNYQRYLSARVDAIADATATAAAVQSKKAL